MPEVSRFFTWILSIKQEGFYNRTLPIQNCRCDPNNLQGMSNELYQAVEVLDIHDLISDCCESSSFNMAISSSGDAPL